MRDALKPTNFEHVYYSTETIYPEVSMQDYDKHTHKLTTLNRDLENIFFLNMFKLKLKTKATQIIHIKLST